jgi:DNA ligase-1
MKNFKPMLAIDGSKFLDRIRYPKFASYKLDGIRAIFHPKLGIVTRSLKPIPNKQIKDKFNFLLKKAQEMNRIFDGEFYCHDMTFQEITSTIMTQDFTDPKTIKKLNKELGENTSFEILDRIDNIEFHCFETHSEIPELFFEKMDIIKSIKGTEIIIVNQNIVNNSNDIKNLFEKALKDGYEGLILRDFKSPYKFGRSTLKEEYMLKVKPFESFDAKIIDVIQATEVNPNAEKTISELGYSITSKKKDDRVLINKASAFLVEYQGKPVKVVIAMTDLEKTHIWCHRNAYIGKMIEYKGMLIGSKDVPRHPVFLRFRNDR